MFHESEKTNDRNLFIQHDLVAVSTIPLVAQRNMFPLSKGVPDHSMGGYVDWRCFLSAFWKSVSSSIMALLVMVSMPSGVSLYS